MNRKIIILIFLIFFSVFSVHATDPIVVKLSQKKLPALVEPDIQIRTLPGGIKLYYLQDQELPVTRINAYFELGNWYEDKGERGISALFMNAWRSGGTTTVKPEMMDEVLEFMAANISVDTNPELSVLKMTCLQKDNAQVLTKFFDLIKNPGFDSERLEVVRTNMINGIKRRNENPMNIAMREFSQSLFGAESPYAWLFTAETVKSITRDMLVRYHKTHVAPNRMLMAASSPLSFDDFVATLLPYLKDFDHQAAPMTRPAELKKEWQKTTEFIQKDGNQSSIVLGHFGERRFNKDKYKLILANEILGGATFGSRLGDRIRTELGLAYSIRSSFGFDTDYSQFIIGTQTKSESTLKTIDEIQKILANMVNSGDLTDDELATARERILNRLVFQLDIPFNIVTMRLDYDYHGYPPNYLTLYQKEVESVTLADIKAVLAAYFFPDKLKVMIVGDRTKITGIEGLAGFSEKVLDNE